ncbi:MAG: hypothetical protein HQL03_05995 [Nitrospirae bacterium]|nr:hypothetical protein [Nitrospirota bacterium]MBF0592677.1 hypothetical protein [Nitrospirota bacterium]
MDSVKPEEKLTRFIFDSNEYRSSDKGLKHSAFMPNNKGKTSVFRISGISDEEIWDIGEREVVPKKGKAMKGRADIPAYEVLKHNLSVDPEEPPPRHANIVSWNLNRQDQRLIAVKLAADANFIEKQ